MAKYLPYVCRDHDTDVDGIHISAGFPFWVEGEPKLGWRRIPEDAEMSPAMPYEGPVLDTQSRRPHAFI
jgi:hypothetical protein